MKNPDIRRFAGKLLLFTVPIWGLVAAWAYFEITLAPLLKIGWAQAVVGPLRSFLPGPYYPRQWSNWHLDGGDLGRNTVWSIPKDGLIQSDEFGYRNSRLKWDSYDIVVVGDSFADGGPISQYDTLPAVLGRRLSQKVYNFAGPTVSLNDFLVEKRFQSHSSKVVLLCFVERNLKNLPKPFHSLPPESLLDRWLETLKYERGFQDWVTALDRCLKARGLDSLKRWLEKSSLRALSSQKGGPFLFLQGDSAPKDGSPTLIQNVVDTIVEYQKVLESRGIRLFFLPVPNKESIYYRFLKNKNRPVYLEKIVKGLEAQGIQTIDLQRVFEKISGPKDDFLYYTDDTHWNARGVRVAVDAMLPVLHRLLEKK